MPFQFVGKRTKSDSVVVLKHLRHMQLGGICSGLLVVRHLLPFLLVRALISFPLLHLAVLWELSSPNPFPRASDTSAQSLKMENMVDTWLPPGDAQDARLLVLLRLVSLKLLWALPLSSQPLLGLGNPLCSLQILFIYIVQRFLSLATKDPSYRNHNPVF